MKIKSLICFAALGAAAFYGSNYTVFAGKSESDPKIQKNLFTGTYTLTIPNDGLVVQFDSRHEKTLTSFLEILKLSQKINGNSEQAQKEVSNQISTIISRKFGY